MSKVKPTYKYRLPARPKLSQAHVSPVQGDMLSGLVSPAGSGPFRVQGHKASDLEWRVYRVLHALKWREDQIDFQVAVFGGFMVPGGQSLDYVLSAFGAVNVLEVHGDHWHSASEAQKQKDKQNENFVRRVMPAAFFHALYTGDIIDDNVAYYKLLRIVGRGG